MPVSDLKTPIWKYLQCVQSYDNPYNDVIFWPSCHQNILSYYYSKSKIQKRKKMKTRRKSKPLLRSKSSTQSKSKACKKCGSYHYPCLCVLEKKKKRDEKKKNASSTSSKTSKASSSSKSVMKISCSCKRGCWKSGRPVLSILRSS